ncbi:MAG: ATP-binding protein [Candidatus Methanofastidiosia archaeon]
MKNIKEKQIEISKTVDVAKAILETGRMAECAGFKSGERCMVTTVVSELGTNILRYAKKGIIIIIIIEKNGKRGIEIVAKDNGPGIKDIGLAMTEYFSSGNGLGIGLPGVKRMMDEFIIDTEQMRGTMITVRKWI